MRGVKVANLLYFNYNISMERKELIRSIYLYLFSFVGLVLVVIGLVRLVDLGLKAFLFTKADQVVSYPSYPIKSVSTDGVESKPTAEELAEYERKQAEFQRAQEENVKARTASSALAMIIVGAPLFLYHWRIIQWDKRN